MSGQPDNAVVYNSGLNVWNPEDLATLSVFYDRILLPGTDEYTRGLCVLFSRPKSAERYKVSTVSLTNLCFTDADGQTKRVEDVSVQWQQRHQLLFDEKVLSRLAPSTASDFSLLENSRVEELCDVLLDIPFLLRSKTDEEESICVWQDHLLHLLRTDIALPGVFLARAKTKPSREMLKGLMAHRAFKFVLPKLSELAPDQILEVRSKLKDTREGFSMHLQSLSAGVESRLKGGETLSEISAYADSVVETQLIPDFVEFRRQLVAERAGFWKIVLEKTGKVFEIDAAPWTPKFYGELLKALGFSLLTGVENQKQNLSNKNQAFQFMRTVEKTEVPDMLQ
jgi:hypothetical protein